MNPGEKPPGDLVARDAATLWHPFTQHGVEDAPLPVVGARGAELTLADGRILLDAISSWWACLHGHGRPELVEALARQAKSLDHVLFAGATHEPAVRLGERLLELAPDGLSRAFFSDNGSTAVEVALKMVHQSWVQRGQPQRTVFVALEGSYHGDTVGAMSVSDPDPFFVTYRSLLFEVARAERTPAGPAAALEALGERAAGFILEPLVQGAAGMVMHDAGFVAAVRAACDRAGVPLIADEVMTGFGRTGALFACEKAAIRPDLMCLSKGLTGGTLPLAVTLASDELYQAFLSEDRRRAFFHGHTYTANPIGCAVALESLRLVLEEDVPARFEAIGRRIESRLRAALGDSERVRELRRTGGIVAIELAARGGSGYFATMGPRMRRRAIELGVLLRPLGNVLYAMPPACVRDEECDRIADAMIELTNL